MVLLAVLSMANFAFALSFDSSNETRSSKLYWKSNLIPISISASLFTGNPAIRPDSDVSGAISRSLETWEKAANIKFEATITDSFSVSPPGKSGDGVSLLTIAQTPENLMLFGGDPNDVSARTRVFYSGKGNITEADIVLNPYQQFSTDGSFGTFDLEATLTHEIGHLLGLEHSLVLGSTMQENQAKNGVYGLPAFSSRTLSEDDIAAVRSIYGVSGDSADCCGSLSGRLTFSKGKPAASFFVWLEEFRTGRVISGTSTNAEGDFSFESLPIGEFDVFVRLNSRGSGMMNFTPERLGRVRIENGKNFVLDRKLSPRSNDFELKYVGFSGQLSVLSIPLEPGKTFVVYLGGRNFDSKELLVAFSSPFINIVPGTMMDHDFGKDLSVVSFEVRLEEEIPDGDYTVAVRKADGASDVLVGVLTVGKQFNGINSYLIN